MLLLIIPFRAIDRSGYHPLLTLPAELTRRYETLLTEQAVAGYHRLYYLK